MQLEKGEEDNSGACRWQKKRTGVPDRPRTGGQSGSLPTGQGPDIERTGEGVRQKRPDRVSGHGPDRGAVPQNGRTAPLSGICPDPVRVPVCRTPPCPDPVRDPCPGVFVFSPAIATMRASVHSS